MSSTSTPSPHRGVIRAVSVAPMMDRTDRHFRYFMRRLTKRTLLYTEMVTAPALLHGDRVRHLQFHPDEHPIALQLGGDDPAELAECAQIAVGAGYDEVNLNVGCPSDRVQSGRFGACLMARPEIVAECVERMRAAVSVPITVKHRIGIDTIDRYEDMLNFVDRVADSGCDRFSVHARKAWLQGLSPKENRTVPPLRYADVYRLKAERPALVIELNGGVKTLEECQTHLAQLDAVMIGRAAYDDPLLFRTVDQRLFGSQDAPVDARDAVLEMADYIAAHIESGGRLQHVTRHLMGLFTGLPGARKWRRVLSTEGVRPDADFKVVERALSMVSVAG